MDSSFIHFPSHSSHTHFLPFKIFPESMKDTAMYEQQGFTEFRRNLLVSESLQINVTAHHNAQK